MRFFRRLDALKGIFPARGVRAKDVALLETTNLSGTVVEVSNACPTVGAPDEVHHYALFYEGEGDIALGKVVALAELGCSRRT